MPAPRIILASRSRARIEMLANAALPFEAIPADVDEEALAQGLKNPREIALKLAREKALAVAAQHPGALVVGCDQTMECEGEIIHKARDQEDAAQKLKKLRGKTHKLASAAVVARDGKILWEHADEASLKMRAFDDAFLERYLTAAGDALTSCVGAYALEEAGAWLFEEVRGDYFTILGMPFLALLSYLQDSHGVSL